MLVDILNQSFLNNTVRDYIIFIAVFLFGAAVITVFKAVFLKRLQSWSDITENKIDDFLIHGIKKELIPLSYIINFYLSIQLLILNPAVSRGIRNITLVICTAFGVRFLLSAIVYGLEIYWLKKEENKEKTQAINGMIAVIKVIIWSLAIIILLDNLGIRISTLVAGLGIGGVAIALAAQAILGDLFSYFTIFFDRPFEIGDFIIIGEYLGVVEHIGIKTTRIRSLGGEQLIFSNTDLTNSRVRNYKRMEKRRVVFKIGITYQTKSDQVKKIPLIVEEIIKSIEDTVFDRAHFFEFGDFSLNFEVVYYVLGSDYNKYMDINQKINLKIKEEFEKHSIEFAYPTQTLFCQK